MKFCVVGGCARTDRPAEAAAAATLDSKLPLLADVSPDPDPDPDPGAILLNAEPDEEAGSERGWCWDGEVGRLCVRPDGRAVTEPSAAATLPNGF
jgi:hypothetical protein